MSIIYTGRIIADVSIRVDFCIGSMIKQDFVVIKFKE